jgi:hypothetical protein
MKPNPTNLVRIPGRGTVAEYVATAGVIAALVAVYLAWTSLLGHDNALLRLLAHFF